MRRLHGSVTPYPVGVLGYYPSFCGPSLDFELLVVIPGAFMEASVTVLSSKMSDSSI